MIKQHMMLALVGTALIAGPALAQSSSSPSGSAQTPSAQSGQTSGEARFIPQAQSGQWRASKLMGIDIYGNNNEKIGDVNEVLIDKNGNAQAVVIGVGGFLGVGQKDVAVPFASIQWQDTPRPTASGSGTSGSGSSSSGSGMSSSSSSSSNGARDYPDHGMISMTKEQLQNAPAFKYASNAGSSSSSSSSSSPSGSSGGSTR